MDFETNFKKDLEQRFRKKELADSSIKLYLRNLEKLNDDTPLKNLNFLKNKEKINKFLENYKENTKRGYLISICSALSSAEKVTKKLYDDYFNDMIEKNKQLKTEEHKNEKSETQNKNWIEWTEVKERHNELIDKVDKFKTCKDINESCYNTLLNYVILSVYFYKQPRRNEYANMNIVKKYLPSMDDKINYLDLDNKQFIFNNFKTSKKEGQQLEKIPDELMNVINLYMKFHPHIKGSKKVIKNINVPFLVNYKGDKLDKVNSITRILNNIFKKKIGSSMLRHIFLSDKYKDVNKEQQKDAQAMGHSVSMQKDYIKI